MMIMRDSKVNRIKVTRVTIMLMILPSIARLTMMIITMIMTTIMIWGRLR